MPDHVRGLAQRCRRVALCSHYHASSLPVESTALAANRAVSKELGLRRASHGMFTGRRVKAVGRWSLDSITGREGVRFTFIYLLSGALSLRSDSGVVSLHAHDAISQVPLSAATLVD